LKAGKIVWKPGNTFETLFEIYFPKPESWQTRKRLSKIVALVKIIALANQSDPEFVLQYFLLFEKEMLFPQRCFGGSANKETLIAEKS
jgi:hypothetical protein